MAKYKPYLDGNPISPVALRKDRALSLLRNAKKASRGEKARWDIGDYLEVVDSFGNIDILPMR